jgi:hypothetical protein
MGLSTYSELIGSLSSWLDGSELDGREADLIALCEDEINARLAAGLQQGAFIRPMAERGPLTVDGDYVDLPDGNLVLPISIEISFLDRSWPVRFTSAERLLELRSTDCATWTDPAAGGAAVPRFYALVGDQIRFHPVPQQSFAAEFTRFSKVPALSDDVGSNWVLASHRNAYLYGALAQAELFGWNDARMANVAGLFVQAVDGIIARYPQPVDRAMLRSEAGSLGTARGEPTMAAFLSGSL